MQFRLGFLALAALLLPLQSFSAVVDVDDADEGHHHGHHHHRHYRHRRHHKGPNNTTKKASAAPTASNKPQVSTQPHVLAKAAVQSAAVVHKDNSIVERMKQLEAKIAQKQQAQAKAGAQGHLLVNGPLPADFNERFAQAVAQATGTNANSVRVTDSTAVEDANGIVEINFVAPAHVVREVEGQAADPGSKLASGNMHKFLVAEKEETKKPSQAETTQVIHVIGRKAKASSNDHDDHSHHSHDSEDGAEQDVTPVHDKGIDIDTEMPYGDLEPFGREDTAQELTESSVKESDEMVDQLERAEVAEEKRSVFRALTRLRGAAITSFDGVARSQTGNIDEYNKVHKWRNTHPLHHLADEESDVSKWAFPDNADF